MKTLYNILNYFAELLEKYQNLLFFAVLSFFNWFVFLVMMHSVAPDSYGPFISFIALFFCSLAPLLIEWYSKRLN